MTRVLPPKRRNNSQEHLAEESFGFSQNQRVFLGLRLSRHDSTLPTTTDSKDLTNRCSRCNYPLKGEAKEPTNNPNPPEGQLAAKQVAMKASLCFICKREKVFTILLDGIYILSAVVFIASIVGVIFDQVPLEIALIFGCLILLGLFFIGRLLEVLLYIKLPLEMKALGALYQFSITGDLQSFEIGMDYMKSLVSKQEVSSLHSEFYYGILYVISQQYSSIPSKWILEMCSLLQLELENFTKIALEQTLAIDNGYAFKRIVSKTNPAGLGALLDIAMVAKNKQALVTLHTKLSDLCSTDTIESDWLQEFFIYEKQYKKMLTLVGTQKDLELFAEKLEQFKPPRVPTIDVIAQSKNIIQRSPLLRYIVRILLYFLVAFIFGLLYKLLD